jgi:CRP/FNR family transcriptional regulator
MRAEQRLAMFLLNLAGRYALRGYSSTSFQLRMSREDIGGYLGLTVESVSRQLARLRQDGSIVLKNRDLRIIDRAKLETTSGDLAQELAAA